MFINVNLETGKIESYRVSWPYAIHCPDIEFTAGSFANSSGYKLRFKVYRITNPWLIAKVSDAITNLAEMKAVFDENNHLIDINVNYPDLGEDR
ncbi:MAG TPA: hypothetical protein VHY08_15775 [Bacillota bacterium]|nr:hypothetical protein [Bacillota bacterium]